MRTRALTSAAILALLVCSQASATPLRLRILDQSGAAFPDVLVIVKSLEGKGEIFRSLTGQTGSLPERDLPAGLYRVIATCPYGVCVTKVTEFLVGDKPLDLELKLDVSPTRGNVVTVSAIPLTQTLDISPQGNVIVSSPPAQITEITVKVLDAQGKPAPAAELLVRDSTAEYERWYKTNGNGEADFDPPGNMVTFAVLCKGVLTEETISMDAIGKLRAGGKKLIIQLK